MSAPQIQYPPTSGGGAPVGGTGTTNTIPRWTGASTLGDSIIIQGSTANAIGIGNAPTTDLAGYKALEVGGLGSGFVNADNDLWITANAKHSGGGWKYAVTASTPSNSIRANAGAIIFNRAGNGTAGNALTWLESARIDSSGNFGVGMTSGLSGKLGVLSANTIGTADLTFSYDATGSYRHGFSNVFSSGTAANNTSTWLVWNAAGGQTQVMTANGAGLVGIGTASPIKKATVTGGDLGLAYGQAICFTNAGTALYTADFAVKNTFSSPNDVLQLQASGSSNGIITFHTGAPAATRAEAARIDSAGNFGIGTGAATTTPAATGSLVIGQNNVSQQWAARIYGGNDANRAPVLSLFRSGNTEGIIAEIKNGAVGALALGITGGVANFNDATLSAACQVQITSTLMDISGSGYGLKLPATPGNADTQTLDAYRENTTWSPTVTWGTGGTVTTTSATGAYTQIGNVVTFTVTIAYNCSVIPTGGSITMDLPRTSATGFNQRPGLWAFNAWNGVAGSNFLSIGSASTTATLRVANATGTADIATYLTVTASGALVITATYLAS